MIHVRGRKGSRAIWLSDDQSYDKRYDRCVSSQRGIEFDIEMRRLLLVRTTASAS